MAARQVKIRGRLHVCHVLCGQGGSVQRFAVAVCVKGCQAGAAALIGLGGLVAGGNIRQRASRQLYGIIHRRPALQAAKCDAVQISAGFPHGGHPLPLGGDQGAAVGALIVGKISIHGSPPYLDAGRVTATGTAAAATVTVPVCGR